MKSSLLFRDWTYRNIEGNNLVKNFTCMTLHTAPSHLIKVIHEHLAHLINRNRCIDCTVQAQFPHSIWQSSQVKGIGVGEENSIDLVNISEGDKRRNMKKRILLTKTQLWFPVLHWCQTHTQTLQGAHTPFHCVDDVH